MKNFYISAWILLAAAVLVSVLTGILNAAALVAFSLIALGLVYALALFGPPLKRLHDRFIHPDPLLAQQVRTRFHRLRWRVRAPPVGARGLAHPAWHDLLA